MCCHFHDGRFVAAVDRVPNTAARSSGERDAAIFKSSALSMSGFQGLGRRPGDGDPRSEVDHRRHGDEQDYQRTFRHAEHAVNGARARAIPVVDKCSPSGLTRFSGGLNQNR